MMELEAKLEEEAHELADRLSSMTDKTSDAYKMLLQRYQDVLDMLDRETKRINSNQALVLEAKKIEVEQDKLEFEDRKLQANTEIEENKIRDSKKNRRSSIIGKVLTGVVIVGGNIATIYFAGKCNDEGFNMTSFQNKFISPVTNFLSK